jgi:hypothetical protein
MHILFEAIRVSCEHGSLNTYDHGLHASCGVKLHSHYLAAPISCRQLLPDDSYKDAFLYY